MVQERSRRQGPRRRLKSGNWGTLVTPLVTMSAQGRGQGGTALLLGEEVRHRWRQSSRTDPGCLRAKEPVYGAQKSHTGATGC